MPETPITLTIAQRRALARLQNTHDLPTISCAAAVETLAGDSESVTMRGEAYAMIRELDRAGAVRYDPVTETVQLWPLRARPAGSTDSTPPQKPGPSTLADFIARMRLRRARAVWEILLLHREQNGGPLPPRLAEQITLRLCNRYRNTSDDFVLTAPMQVRHLIFCLRNCGFLQSTDTQGVYYITPAGLAQALAVERLVVPFLPVPTATSEVAHEPAPTDQALTPK